MTNSFRLLTLVAALLATVPSLSAQKAIDLDSATIADLNAAFSAGTLTAEKLTQMSLARIEAYDRQGPRLRAVITVNLKALDTARALDAERRTKGPRSPLHGIPVVLKDNFDTADMPTTGGSVLLEGSIPRKDAFLVKKLRDAGAVIIAKANMSEFASGTAHSSLGGQILNPHDLTRTPLGSSGLLASERLDAIVYPTEPLRPALITAPPEPPGGSSRSPVNLANLSGYPDLIVPAGFTGDDLPVGLSFLGPAFSEGKLLALGYSFEQATHARRLPVHTPRLQGESITVP